MVDLIDHVGNQITAVKQENKCEKESESAILSDNKILEDVTQRRLTSLLRRYDIEKQRYFFLPFKLILIKIVRIHSYYSQIFIN